MNLKTSMPLLMLLSACASKPSMLDGVIQKLKESEKEKLCFTVLKPQSSKGQYCLTDVEKIKLKMQKARDAKAQKAKAPKKQAVK